jgi:hypothetical protein
VTKGGNGVVCRARPKIKSRCKEMVENYETGSVARPETTRDVANRHEEDMTDVRRHMLAWDSR